jgi:hypothetical protein
LVRPVELVEPDIWQNTGFYTGVGGELARAAERVVCVNAGGGVEDIEGKVYGIGARSEGKDIRARIAVALRPSEFDRSLMPVIRLVVL